MKKSTIYALNLIVLCILFSCQKDTNKTNDNASNNISTNTGTDGKVVITINTRQCVLSPGYLCVHHSLGLGYSSTDIANNAFFSTTSNSKMNGDKYSYDLKPGIYYYKVKSTSDCSGHSGGSEDDCLKKLGYTGTNSSIEQNGSFVINSNSTTLINVTI